MRISRLTLEAASRSAAVAQTGAVSAQKFGSAVDALRSGVRDYNAGDKVGAARALEYAATQGHALALWKLGRMYADGDGVPHDDLRAFEYFSKIADESADDTPESPTASVVASAFVALGTYFLDGIPNTYVKPDAARAGEMYHYAASYFGDSNAQYNLARLYLDGNGVEQDVRQAARWFNLAAEKGHHPAQALLGHLLVTGQGIPRQRAQGLMWLTLAREGADPSKEAWIAELHEKAFASAPDGERQAALGYLEQHLRKKR
jgi:hypothetical protein